MCVQDFGKEVERVAHGSRFFMDGYSMAYTAMN